MNNKLPQLQSRPKPQTVNPFAKSPVELGGSQAPKNTKPLSLSEHFDGALNYIADSLFGGGNTNSDPSKGSDGNSSSSSNPFAEALKEHSKNSEFDSELKKQQHLTRHKELQMQEVFDLEKKKSEETIKQLKIELELLVKEIKTVDSSIKTVVFQEEVNPGVYHVNFFTQLRNFLILLRKRVKEGATWLQSFHSKKGKSKYQQNSAKYGSKYMFGQEGQGLTRQTG